MKDASKRLKLMVSSKNMFQSSVANSRRGTPSILARHLSEDTSSTSGESDSPKLQPEPPPGLSPTGRSSSTAPAGEAGGAAGTTVDTQAVERVVARLLAAHSTEVMQAIGDLQAAQTALVEKVDLLSRGREG